MMAELQLEPTRYREDETVPLKHGDRLDQATFHARYEQMPEDVRAELIGGVVYMPSPIRKPHSRLHTDIIHWLKEFEIASRGLETLTTPSIILSDYSEPEPDVVLRVLPSYGGMTQDQNEYVTGSPELVVEVSYSSAAFDLKPKKLDYERAGILEYLVFLVEKQEVCWFALEEREYKPIHPDEEGILHSRYFPGLWLQPETIFSSNHRRTRRILRRGISSREHKEWVSQLAAAAKLRRKHSPPG